MVQTVRLITSYMRAQVIEKKVIETGNQSLKAEVTSLFFKIVDIVLKTVFLSNWLHNDFTANVSLTSFDFDTHKRTWKVIVCFKKRWWYSRDRSSQRESLLVVSLLTWKVCDLNQMKYCINKPFGFCTISNTKKYKKWIN